MVWSGLAEDLLVLGNVPNAIPAFMGDMPASSSPVSGGKRGEKDGDAPINLLV